MVILFGNGIYLNLLENNLEKNNYCNEIINYIGLNKIKNELYSKIKKIYDIQSDPKYAAARMWIDEIIDPRETRNILIRSLEITANQTKLPEPNFGVLQV